MGLGIGFFRHWGVGSVGYALAGSAILSVPIHGTVLDGFLFTVITNEQPIALATAAFGGDLFYNNTCLRD